MGKKRRGRPPSFVKNPHTRLPVYGLSMDANGYYYSFWRGEKLPKRPHFGPPGVECFQDAYDNYYGQILRDARIPLLITSNKTTPP